MRLYLKRLLTSPEGLKILGRNIEGWTCGGCFILAKALHIWSRGKFRIAVVMANGVHQHFVVFLPNGLVVDGDGTADEYAMLYKLIKYEGLQKPYVKLFDKNETFSDIPRSPKKIKQTVRFLTKHLGPYKGRK